MTKLPRYITEWGVPDSVEGSNTIEDLEQYLSKDPYPNYRLVNIIFLGGNWVIVWELKDENKEKRK